MTQNDPALETFDRLRLRDVKVEDGDTALAFLAKFQSTAASLEPDERIALADYTPEKSFKLLKTALSDPQASKICELHWRYDGKVNADSIIPLLINNCPELASLQVNFKHCSAFDFASSVLEHPGNKLKVLAMPESTKGNLPRFFAALAQSQVSALSLFNNSSPVFKLFLWEYLQKDLLVRLDVWMQVPSEMLVSLAKCTRLAALWMCKCQFFEATAFALPQSITKLKFNYCWFHGAFDWSFLTDSNVRELVFFFTGGVDGSRLGGTLAVLLRAKGLDELCLSRSEFVNQTLAAIGLELGRVKRLDLQASSVDDAFFELIALVLQSPGSELRELKLEYDGNTVSGIETHLVAALRHPNCTLSKLTLSAYQEHKAAAKGVEDKFRNRRALFALLQGQQVRRLHCPLRRLPVEMFRMVGEVLL